MPKIIFNLLLGLIGEFVASYLLSVFIEMIMKRLFTNKN